jgi:hypothetical protein
MSKPLSAHRHVGREPYTRAMISPFGGYVQVPVPSAPMALHRQTTRTSDPASVARTTLNPAKAANGHAEMHTRNYGTGGAYTFRERVGGVVPGYAGHRPGARDVAHTMAYGGVPTFNKPTLHRPPGQGQQLDNRPTTAWQEIGRSWKQDEPGDSRSGEFLSTVGGVLTGYSGFVPNARTHCGSAHVGGLALSARGRSAQRGHSGRVERLHGDRELDVSSRTERAAKPMVGYQGHVPKAMDSFGTSHWRERMPSARRAQADLYSA